MRPGRGSPRGSLVWGLTGRSMARVAPAGSLSHMPAPLALCTGGLASGGHVLKSTHEVRQPHRGSSNGSLRIRQFRRRKARASDFSQGKLFTGKNVKTLPKSLRIGSEVSNREAAWCLHRSGEAFCPVD